MVLAAMKASSSARRTLIRRGPDADRLQLALIDPVPDGLLVQLQQLGNLVNRREFVRHLAH